MTIFRAAFAGKGKTGIEAWARGAAGRGLGLLFPLLAVVLVMAGGCRGASSTASAAEEIGPEHLWMFSPLGSVAPATGVVAEKVNLGRRLYYETHLSTNNSLSCNSCHDLGKYGVDPGQAVSTGHNGKQGGRNSPTVYNAVLQFAQFWDGRAPTLAAQASGPMMNPVEMGMSGPQAVLAVLHANPDYVKQFQRAYPGEKDAVTMENVTDAIATFESRLLTPSRWDDYLHGNTQALTEAEKNGLRVYIDSGCGACHAGTGMGGNSYQKLGAFKDWPDETSDRGRFAVTGELRDSMYFKVPMLRNVEETGPWFHDGKVNSLAEAVRLMGEYQTGRKLSEEQIRSIVTFLHALTGPIPRDYVQPQPANAPPEAAVRPVSRPVGHRGNLEKGE
jgi:cytochrome c peroxidase